jgi:hypothetical protein
MSTKLIIYVGGKPLLNGHKQREFIWVPAYGCYLYEGQEIPASEFNVKYEKAMRNNADMNPRVKVVSDSPCSVSCSCAPLAITTATPPPYSVTVVPTPVERVITAEEAEAVLQRLAPERLKKKTGPKPKPVLQVI